MSTHFCWDTARTLVMGVLNVTPDSFSDGGQFLDVDRAVEHGQAMARAGADIIDIGGESSRPGSTPVSAEEEISRVLPVIQRLCAKQADSTAPRPVLSIDTTKAAVARQALAAGARIVNDVSALRDDPAMADVIREFGAGVVLLHMQGTPQTMQQNPHYGNVVGEVREFLAERIAQAVSHGIRLEQIAVDPGIGFGKSLEHNLKVLARLEDVRALGRPVMVGTSRKSFIGALLGKEVQDRLAGTLATIAWCVVHGANIVRVHDVAETVQVIRVIDELRRKRIS